MAAAVQVLDSRFSPRTATIAAGGTVTWTWGGAAIHDVTGDFGASPLQTTGSFAVTFPTPGTYSYFCSVHSFQGMRGTIVVE